MLTVVDHDRGAEEGVWSMRPYPGVRSTATKLVPSWGDKSGIAPQVPGHDQLQLLYEHRVPAAVATALRVRDPGDFMW